MKSFFLALLLVFQIALVIAPAPSGAVAPSEPAASPLGEPSSLIIKDIQYESFDKSAILAIKTSGIVDYVVYELQDPYRIVIDPLDPVWCDFEESISFDEGMVRSIKFIRGSDMPDGPGAPYYPFDFVTIELVRPCPFNFKEDQELATLNIGDQRPSPAETEGRLKDAKVIEDQIVREFDKKEEDAINEEKNKIELLKQELDKKKEEINAAKDELGKERERFDQEKASVGEEKERVERERANIGKEKDLLAKAKTREKKDFKPRPVREYSEDMLPPEFKGKALSLDECTQIAVSNSLAVKIASEKADLAKMKVNESFRELFPEFSLMLDKTKGTISDAWYKGAKVGFEFKQPISHGGEIIAVWEQSKVNLKVAKETLNKEKEEVILNAAKAFYEFAKALNKYEYQKALMEDAKADFAIAKKEYDMGLLSKIDFMNIESSMNHLIHTLLTNENSALLARLGLNKVMNVSVDTEPAIDSKLEYREVDIDGSECVSLALQYRPEYRISYLNTEVAKWSERIAKSNTFPQVDIFAKYLKAAERLEPFVEPLRHYYLNEGAVGATVSVPMGPNTFDYQYKQTKLAPTVSTFESGTRYWTDKLRLSIFDNMERYSSIKDASVKYKEALDDFNKSEQTMYSDVSEALFSFTESKLKIKNAENDLTLYEKELEVVKVKKGLNESNFYDLIQAKTKVYGERGNYTDAVGDYLIATARINRAIGLGGYYNGRLAAEQSNDAE